MIRILKKDKSIAFGAKLVQLIFFLVIIIHWIACLWYYVIDYHEKDTWRPLMDVVWGANRKEGIYG